MAASLKDRILKTLATVDRPGSFSATGTSAMVLPGLEVDGIGPVGLPLNEASARQLIAQCHQAPYGKGTQTVVDTSVRNVWELDPKQFRLVNPLWQLGMDKIVNAIRNDLGLTEHTLNCQLYKLLIYEKGGFFLPHQDGEKVDRMVATCVVCLPSSHDGGELIIRHGGQEVIARFDDPRLLYMIQYAAFYADCEHEVRPVRSGHRICLVYNLVLTRKSSKRLQAPNFGRQTDELAATLEEWKTSAGATQIAIALSHEYSKEGLRPENLKGEDQSRATIIAAAAAKAGCRATLGLMTLWESGYGADDSEAAYYGHRSHYKRRRETSAVSEYRMIEVYDDNLTVDHWVGLDGTQFNFGELTFVENQLVSPRQLKDLTPEEDFEGYTGNAGMTLERWYRQAVIAIWPESMHYRSLCGAGTNSAVRELLRMANQIRGLSNQEKLTHRQECFRFAQAILQTWKSEGDYYGAKKTNSDLMVTALWRIGSRKLFRRFLERRIPQTKALGNLQRLAKLCSLFGWDASLHGLTAVFQKSEGRFLQRNAEFLYELCLLKTDDAECRNMLLHLAELLLKAIETWAQQSNAPSWEDRDVQAKPIVNSIVRALILLGDDAVLGKALKQFQETTNKFDLVKIHIPVATDLMPFLGTHSAVHSNSLHAWLKTCELILKQRTANEPQFPATLEREPVLSCQCPNCKAVNAFLQNADLNEFAYKARQDLRSHLDRQVKNDRADLTTSTIRKGSPQTLLCIKNTNSFEREHETWRTDCQSLEIIQSMLTPELPSKSRKTRRKKQ